MSKPIVEAKVKIGAASSAVSGLILSALAAWLGVVPDGVVSLVTTVVAAVVPGVVTFAAGWITRHTDRVDLEVAKHE